MGRYLPLFLAVAAIVGLTVVQIRMTDRLSGSNVSAEQRAKLLDNVPIKIGDWQGEDLPIDPQVLKKSGAIGAVQRQYRNVRSGEVVSLWLIVGHARQVSFHTPDVCYPSSGFKARGKESASYTMVFPGQPDTAFLTNTFFKEDEATGQQLVRVFWTWYDADSNANDGKVVWVAPTNARWHFGNTRALYKMYFTSVMRDPMETTEQSACLRFARDFLPVVYRALSEVHNPDAETPGGAVAQPEGPADVPEQPEGQPSAPPTAEAPPAVSAPTEIRAAAAATETFQELPSEKTTSTTNDQDLFANPPPAESPAPTEPKANP